jgi:hypothetical protein
LVSAVSARALKRGLQTWIAELPNDDRAKDAAPFAFEEHGVRISLKVWPRHKRENGGRAIGVRHFPVQQVSPNQDAHTALKKKATRYGVLDYPFVVALNSLRLFHREENVVDALIGASKVVLKKTGDGKEEINEVRELNGIWFGPSGPRARALSAVLSLDQIDPWNFAARRALLIRNPWAIAKLPAIPFGTDELNPNEGKFQRADGGRLSTIFGLSENWPRS